MAAKPVKMKLADFLGTSTSSWADEIEENLPSGPSSQYDGAAGYSDSSYSGQRKSYGNRDRSSDNSYGRNNRYEERPNRNVPLPTQPPFTAFVGNLDWAVTREDLTAFFGSESVSNVKVITDRETQKPKGHAYVEFHELEGLKAALTLANQDLNGRAIKIDIAESKERPTQRADSASTWRREGPVDLPPRGIDRSGSGGGFGGHRNQDGERGFGGQRNYGGQRNQDGERSYAGQRSYGGHRNGDGERSQEGRRQYDRQGQGSYGEQKSYGGQRGYGVGERKNERRQYDSNPRENEFSEAAPTTERKKLQLAPRTKPITAESSSEPSPTETSSKKSSPFGAAKPVDTDKVLKKIESKLETVTISESEPEKDQ